ncbi:MAG TPA: AbrB/MazE/SpoVT family DNA-binding domain-containing protein [Tepidisphaeraceae bacterium]|jgi:antitoxin component of MazEF toxin-antitoxin module|nr:AbrB/MazE/SpoVT family DNA-binding domain-containing protein [Tepidisphaeraceae bacterium]
MPTVVKVRKWGNSLGVRLPKSFTAENSIVDGATVEIDNLRIVDVPKRRRRSGYKLKDLLKGYVKPPKSFDFPAAGKELA